MLLRSRQATTARGILRAPLDAYLARLAELGVPSVIAVRSLSPDSGAGAISIAGSRIRSVSLRREASLGGDSDLQRRLTEIEIPDPNVGPGPRVSVTGHRNKRFILFGRHGSVSWSGSKITKQLRRRLEHDERIAREVARRGSIDIHSGDAHWIVRFDDDWWPPTSNLWRCYEAIAGYLLATSASLRNDVATEE